VLRGLCRAGVKEEALSRCIVLRTPRAFQECYVAVPPTDNLAMIYQAPSTLLPYPRRTRTQTPTAAGGGLGICRGWVGVGRRWRCGASMHPCARNVCTQAHAYTRIHTYHGCCRGRDHTGAASSLAAACMLLAVAGRVPPDLHVMVCWWCCDVVIMVSSCMVLSWCHYGVIMVAG
jgi:hypothetical protein